MKFNMNENWYFTEQFSEELKLEAEEACKKMKLVRLPHTVKEMESNYCAEREYQMESGYLRKLFIPKEWEGQKLLLTFGAAAHEAEVFCNGESLYTHRCGYTAFTIDLTEHVRYGEENWITVRLDSRETLNIPPFGHVIDYMTFGGLYRGVTLEIKHPSHLTDVFAIGTARKLLKVQLQAEEAGECKVSARVTDEKGALLKELPLMDYQETFELNVPEAKLWNLKSPHLYHLDVQLYKNGEEVDHQRVRFGFRTVSFLADGFYLNGKKVKIRGLNRHQSYPYIGYAAPEQAQAYDADILKKELGCNAVRTSHYPQSHGFLDRCDELGLLVFTEFPGWQHIGDENWKAQAVENVKEMVLQYRNHPSIFLWGVRINESPDDDAFYEKTNAVAHKLDPSRPTGGVRCIKKSNLLEDVYTYNDFFHKGDNKGCEPKQSVTSDMKKGYLISENNGHMFPTKTYDWEEKRCAHALRHAAVLDEVRAQRDIAGSFGWCMFDYNTHQDFGSGDRVCYHGVMDMFRNPKMAAAVFAAEGLRKPVLEISSSMDIGDHPACNLGDVYAFTNGDFVKLYKNEKFIASFAPGKKFSHMQHPPILIDDTIGCLLEKEEGYDKKTAEQVKTCLYAVAKYGQAALPPQILLLMGKLMLTKHFTMKKGNELYSKYIGSWGGKTTIWTFKAYRNGKEIAQVKKGPVTNPRLQVTVDRTTLQEKESWDMATVRIRAVDDQGSVLPYWNRAVQLKVQGDLELIGPSVTTLCGGTGGTYLRTKGKAGTGTLVISASGAEPVTISFTVQKEGEAQI